MRTLERSSTFKSDYKRAKASSHHGKDVDSLVSAFLTSLMSDQPLPKNNRDHALRGDWVGYRECHIKPDLLLIYRKPDPDTLCLARRQLFKFQKSSTKHAPIIIGGCPSTDMPHPQSS